MPRRGWHNEQWAEDWLRILMGPRPPSVHWPRAQQNRRNQSAAGQRGAGKVPSKVENKKPESKVPKKDPEAVPKVRVSPAEAAVKASARVARLEAALAVLEDSDEADGAEVVQLKDSLKKARVQAAPTNLGRLDECQQYVARARRRLEKAQSAVAEAQCLAQTLQQQLDAGLAELEALRREATGIPQEPVDNTSEVADLRRQVQQLRQERDNWLLNRGGHQQADGVGGKPTDPSSLMLDLVEAGDAKRRCLGSSTSSVL